MVNREYPNRVNEFSLLLVHAKTRTFELMRELPTRSSSARNVSAELVDASLQPDGLHPRALGIDRERPWMKAIGL